MRTIIQNGTIVSDTAAFRADLLLEDGVVKAVGAGLSAPDAQVIDASGKYVLPGAVDVHTHMDLQAGAHRAVDDFYTACSSMWMNGCSGRWGNSPTGRVSPASRPI